MTPVVHLVDNDPRILRSLARLFEIEGIATTSSTSAKEFLAHYDADVPGCLVLDLAMPGESGLELQEALHRSAVPVPVVFLSGCGDVPSSVNAMKHGAVDFLTKPVDADALLGAVQRAIEQDLAQRARAADDARVRAALDRLTPREHEILPWLVSGKLNKQIAAELGVVEKTVKVHRMHVMEKLGLHSLADLVRLVERQRIAPAPVGPTPN
ncbi:DNA-binding response regulator [Lysobacter helvus]|uniref:DNA-binding response regulator n=3 Tax=Lysobacterales TaxID=135614 RepID=A0ABN6FWA9_9GAMM|nr:DNA-binding response regulator [Lysobacter caseinilyticus]BCT97079.1 DNA-binding response regulator [Lysobacter helvus]